jgi:hypothetical protein
MDGYLAVYRAAAALFLADWPENRGDMTLLAAAGALGVAGGLKLEAQVVYLALGISLSLLIGFGRVRLPRPRYPMILLALVPFADYGVWQILQRHWALRGERYGLAHALPRISDPAALWQITKGVLFDQRVLVAMLVLGTVYGFLRLRGQSLPSAAWLPLLAGVLYLAGIFAIFTMTGVDLS